MPRIVIVAAVCLEIVSGAALVGQARSIRRFDAVPTSLRISFRSILSRAVAAQESRDWKGLYALQWPDAIEHRSMEQFIAVRKDREWVLSEFSVLSIDSDNPSGSLQKDGSWTVIGCARMIEKSREESRQSAIGIYRVNGEWFASEVRIVVAMDGGSDWPSCRAVSGNHPDQLWKPEGRRPSHSR